MFRNEDTPVAVGLVVDHSGSLRRKLPEVLAASDAFVRSSNPEDQMFIVNFNEHVSLGLPPDQAFVSDPDQLKTAMSQIRARGQTSLYDAITEALVHFRQSPLEKKVLIVLSDGGDKTSTHRFPDVLTMLQRSDLIVYTVASYEYDVDRNPGVLKQLARVSGGEAFLPKEIPEVTGVLQAVSRDIRNQYTIGYEPSDAIQNGAYRSIRITLSAPDADRWTVRTRTGYSAAPPVSDPGQARKTKQP